MSLNKIKRLLEKTTMEVTSSQLMRIFYNLCKEYSILPDKIVNEITVLKTLKAKIDSDVIAEFLSRIDFDDFKTYLSWSYDIDDNYWGGSQSTGEVDSILEKFYNIEWLGDTGKIARISDK